MRQELKVCGTDPTTHQKRESTVNYTTNIDSIQLTGTKIKRITENGRCLYDSAEDKSLE